MRNPGTVLLSILFSILFTLAAFSAEPKKEDKRLFHFTVSGTRGNNGPNGHSYGRQRQQAQDSGLWGYGTQYLNNEYGLNSIPAFAILNYFTSSASTGSTGNSGGNAGPSTSGGAAGNIEFKLTSKDIVGGSGWITAIINYTHPSSGAGSKSEKIEILPTGFIDLEAIGGGGGHGGFGGDGQPGGPGSRGADATRYTWGGNGGNGGSGGSGGSGSNGSDGGPGGTIRVQLNEKDMGLLMIVRPFFGGGIGGRPGDHGKGGQGGEGGRGGNAYFWTETEYRTAYRTVTDADGNTSQESYQESYEVPHFNPGGSSGYDGSSGHTPTSHLSSGKNGNPGKITYEILTPQGPQTYDSIYDLRLTNFEWEGLDGDGILEPGETIVVKNLRVQNQGGMPTPPHQPIKIYIANRTWVVSDESTLMVEKSLAPGEFYEVPGQLTFKVLDTEIETFGKRFVSNEQIVPLGVVTEVERSFGEDFDRTPDILTFTFPVEIEEVLTTPNIGIGETAKVTWKIKNISQKALGFDSELARKVLIKLGLAENGTQTVTLNDVEVVDPNGRTVNLANHAGHSFSIIPPGETIDMVGTVKPKSTAQPYAGIELTAGMQISSQADPTQLKKIQNVKTIIRVSQTYQHTPGAGVLLIANQDTTRNEIVFWEKLAKQSGLPLDVWDISYNGHLDLSLTVPNGKGKLEDQIQDKIVILLDNPITIPGSSKTIQPLELLPALQVMPALLKSNILRIGPNSKNENMVLLHNPLLLDPERYADFREYLRTLMWWGKPSIGKFKQVAGNRWNQQMRLDPENDVWMTYDFQPSIKKKYFWGLIKTWDYGTLQIAKQETQDFALGILSLDSINQMHLQNAEDEKVLRLAFYSTLPTKTKLKLITQDLKKNILQPELIQAIMAEYGHDLQKKLDAPRTKSVFFEAMLDVLAQLKESVKARTTTPETAMQFLSRLRNVYRQNANWFERNLPFTNARAQTEEIRKATNLVLSEFKNVLNKRDLKSAETQWELLNSNLKKAPPNNTQSLPVYPFGLPVQSKKEFSVLPKSDLLKRQEYMHGLRKAADDYSSAVKESKCTYVSKLPAE